MRAVPVTTFIFLPKNYLKVLNQLYLKQIWQTNSIGAKVIINNEKR